jgi:hypothetical protein
MSNKSVEAQLKEAIEASKQTLALSEQVTSLASEKETLSQRLAEIESALTPKAEVASGNQVVITQLAQLIAERDYQAKQIADLKAATEAVTKALASQTVARAAKADLKEYIEQQKEEEDAEDCAPMKGKKSKAEMPQFIKDKIEEKEEEDGEAEAVDVNYVIKPSGKKAKRAEMPEFIKEKIEEKEEAEAEDCEPTTKGKKAGKATKAYDGDFGDLSDEEVQMIKQYRRQNGEEDYESKKAKKADSELSAPTEEDDKNFDKSIPGQPLAPSGKKSKKADSNLSNPTVEEGKNFDKELPQGGLDPEKNNVNEDNTTSPTIAKSAKKAKSKGETDVEEIIESPDMQNEEGEGHEHEKTLSKPEGKYAKKAEDNSIGGVNKNDVTGQPDQDDEESFLNKKDAKGKAKKAEDITLDPVEAAIQKFASLSQAKVAAEQETSGVREMLALETKAKGEAQAAVQALHAKFEALMGKVAAIEAGDKSVEMKAAKIVASQGVDPVASATEGGEAVKTDSDILKEFDAITDARAKNKFFNANRIAIERVAQSNLKRRS